MKLKHKLQTYIEIDYNDLDEFINETYGEGFEFVVIKEANNDSCYTYTVPSKYTIISEKEKQDIRNGIYKRASINQILSVLYEDKHIIEGEYLINVNW